MADDIDTLQKLLKKVRPSEALQNFLPEEMRMHQQTGLPTEIGPFYIRHEREEKTRARLDTWAVWVSNKSPYGAVTLETGFSDVFSAFRRMTDYVEAYAPIRPFGQVYFIGSKLTPGRPIKIGFSRDPQDRLKNLQTGHPERLQIFATVPGDKDLEAKYPRRWKTRRQSGEWFTLGDCIINEIARINAA